MPTPAERRHLELKGTQPLLTMTRSKFDEDDTIEVMVDER